MKKIITWMQGLERTEVTYWIGLVMLFAGLCLLYSAPMALLTTGTAMATESVVTSYLASWMAFNSRKK
jgi:hypothetical protein